MLRRLRRVLTVSAGMAIRSGQPGPSGTCYPGDSGRIASRDGNTFPFGRSGRNPFNVRRLRGGIVGLMVLCIELMKLACTHTGMRGH